MIDAWWLMIPLMVIGGLWRVVQIESLVVLGLDKEFKDMKTKVDELNEASDQLHDAYIEQKDLLVEVQAQRTECKQELSDIYRDISDATYVTEWKSFLVSRHTNRVHANEKQRVKK